MLIGTLCAIVISARAAETRPMSAFRAMRTISNLSRLMQRTIAELRNPQEYVDVYPSLGGEGAKEAADRLEAAGMEFRTGADGRIQVRHENQTSARLIVDGLLDSAEYPYVAPPAISDWGM